MRSVLKPLTKFESLEGRRLLAAPSAVGPDQGIDLQFLSDVQNDTNPVILQNPDPVKRVPMPNGFQWFDGTHDSDLIAHGGQLQFVMVNGWNVWPLRPDGSADRTGEPNEANVRGLANWAASRTDTLVVDVEEWQMDIRTASKAVVDQNIARFQNIISWIRDEQPDLKVGIYSIFPVSDLFSTIQYEGYADLAIDPVAGSWYRYALPGASNAHAKLQQADAYLHNLAQQVDYVFPALYTSSSDWEMWRRYAEGSVFNARRYGKPVIPFIMPTYHHAANLGLAVMPAEMWQGQLDLLERIADGVVIWTDPYAPVSSDEYWITIALNKINGSGGSGNLTSNITGAPTGSLLPSKPDRISAILIDDSDDEDDSFNAELVADLLA